MAMTTSTDKFNQELYLSPDQQDLLLAALTSNNPSRNNLSSSFPRTVQNPPPKSLSSTSPQQGQRSSIGSMKFNQLYESPQQQTPGSDFDVDLDNSPFIDYELDLDADGKFDYDIDGQMIGNLPGAPSTEDGETETHDKRKSMDDHSEEDGGGKRREGEDKTAKKPGRKPLTSEPTSKRKAQNRAAQRAFRERKEKHLKDLETKVADLEKASESTNHENSLLRAQVERLQTELREYRKRLQLNAHSLGRSPSISGLPSYMNKNNLVSSSNNFSFEFPRFGTQLTSNGLKTAVNSRSETPRVPGVLQRPSPQMTGSASPKSKPQSNGNNSTTSPQKRSNSGIESLAGLFSPSILESVSKNSSYDYMFPRPGNNVNTRGSGDSSTGLTNTPQLNGGANLSFSASPSASSVSQHGPGSSCGTSPEPSNNSPTNGKAADSSLNTIDEEFMCKPLPGDEISFCDSLNMACGNPNNPVPRTMSQSHESPFSSLKTPASDINGIDWLAQQNGGQFDPVLFGDYREPQDAITSGDFGGFFNDAFALPDLSPFQDDAKKGILPELDDDEEEEFVPGEDRAALLNCNKICGEREDGIYVEKSDTGGLTTGSEILDVGFGLTANARNRERLQTIPKVTSGQIDLEELCSELRTKARCSESGVVVDEKDFNNIVSSLPAKNR